MAQDANAVVGQRRRRRTSAVAGASGLLFAAGGTAFVVRSLLRDRAAAMAALDEAAPAWVALGTVLAAVGMTAVAVPWVLALRMLGAPVRGMRHVSWYFLGEIGKYLPGGIWPVLGRAEIARRRGVGSAAAYGSVVLSLGALYLAAVATAVALAPLGMDPAARIGWWMAGAALLPLGVLALHPACVKAGLRAAERLLRRKLGIPVPPWGASLRYVGSYLPAWALIALATWCLARALAPEAPIGPVAFAAVVSWIVGFLAVPVPGGVGVREAVFVAIAGLNPGVAAAVAVLARTIFVSIDVVGALAGGAWMTRPGRIPDAD